MLASAALRLKLRYGTTLTAVVELTSRDLEGGLGTGFSLPRMLDLKTSERKA